jgi:hypothetical protein
MWGASLDDDDRRAIDEDLARRARSSEPAPQPVSDSSPAPLNEAG